MTPCLVHVLAGDRDDPDAGADDAGAQAPAAADPAAETPADAGTAGPADAAEDAAPPQA